MKNQPFVKLDFSDRPYLVIWEMTRSCALKCKHCRAEAIDTRNPEELDREQAFRLLDEIRRFGETVVVLTGGDPMRHPDAPAVVEYGTKIGLKMAMTPSGTREMTFEKIEDLKNKGLSRLAVSLDGSTPQIHDEFRQVPGSYRWTMNVMRWANDLGLSLQINTTVTKYNFDDLAAIASILEAFEVSLWSVFFLVPMGRARLADEVGAGEFEEVFNFMAELSKKSSFDIKSTEAPQYRRVLIQTRMQPGARDAGMDSIGRAAMGVNDGKGFVFVSHTGDICPSGFLPIAAGNVKHDSIVEIYRHSEIFKTIRNASLLKGKCGACEFKSICGGSRARAYSMTGDFMEADPFCVHVPKGYTLTDKDRVYW